MNLWDTLAKADGVSRVVSLLLLCMSVASWFIILYKSRLLQQAVQQLASCKALFWQASDWTQARAHWQAADPQAMFSALLDAAATAPESGLGAAASREDQLTRRLREALQTVRARLQWGQDLLATIGATAPFVGLLGTVWGIFHALTNLAVAIPAVMAYNLMGRRLVRLDAELEGLAYDLRALALAPVPNKA